MFSELIYTRCRQGINILQSGKPLSGDGFKVFHCTQSLMNDGKTDLPLLDNAAHGKQSYAEPDFMDDAYLYLVPDTGDAFMVDFHPIPYDRTAQGDYSHRAGNFINQILVGDYSGFYPFELFNDDSIWTAKGRGEAFYYENEPTNLPVHADVCDPTGQISVDDLAAFIADGRQEALKKAVSFIIAQYKFPVEQRKFLVIRDESSAMIERWIAAIEHAFSPRIAAAIPFATRLDKFATANRYTVNQMGLYQTQINLQDPKQLPRYRAMIVGVDERDRTNAAAVRPLANSPFVLLNGKEKTTQFEADISKSYYSIITAFNDDHQSFCREFLQMLDIKEPGAPLFRLYDIYVQLSSPTSLPNTGALVDMLAVLAQYRMFDCSKLRDLYQRILKELPIFLREDLHGAFQIILWLQTVAQVVGDHEATSHLTEILCRVFAEQVFTGSVPDKTYALWESIKSSGFVFDVANYIMAPKTLQKYSTYLETFKARDGIMFVLIYLECATFMRTITKQDIIPIIDYGLDRFCAPTNDCKSAEQILRTLFKIHGISVQDILLSIAKKADMKYTQFIIRLLVETDNSIIASDSSMISFHEKLKMDGMEQLFVFVLQCRVNAIDNPTEIESLIRLARKIYPDGYRDLAVVFEAFDKKIILGEKNSIGIAVTIQQEKPKDAICSNSAHIYALEVLNNKRKRKELTSIYNTLIPQGFPLKTDSEYIRVLTWNLLRAQLDIQELSYFVQLFARVPEYITELIRVILDNTTQKRPDEWIDLVDVAAKLNNQIVDETLIMECSKLKNGMKALSQLKDMLYSKQSREYFKYISEEAYDRINSKKQRPIFKRLFK